MTCTQQIDDGIRSLKENKFIICADIAKGCVREAWVTGKMIQKMRYFLDTSRVRENLSFIQLGASLCNPGHALAATRALEHLIGLPIPQPVRVLRNIAHGMQFLIDHLTAFYVFHATDWINLGRALQARPEAVVAYARTVNPALDADSRFYAQARQRLAAQASGEGGTFFAVGDKDHPGYLASPEACLLLASHVPAAMAIRAKLARVQELLHGPMAGETAWQCGGRTRTGGPDDGAARPSPAVLAQCAAMLGEGRRFVERVFWPDVLLLADIYRDWTAIGRTGTLLCWGEFPGARDGESLYPRGLFRLGPTVGDQPASPDRVTEEGEPAWSARDAARYRLRFGTGQARYQWPNEDFTWIGVPRHAGLACEVGPLARLVGAYARGYPAVTPLVDEALATLGLSLADLASTIGRVVARGLEALVCSRAAETWLHELKACLPLPEAVRPDSRAMPVSGEGVGTAELTRGALVHRIRVEDGRIVRHEALAPSLWNFSPRDGAGRPGPLEQALRDTPVADPTHPLELWRVVHAFDPCNACGLRVREGDGGRLAYCNV